MHFYQVVTPFDTHNDLGKQRLNPFQQYAATRIAYP